MNFSELEKNNQIYSNMTDLLIFALCLAPKIPENIVLYRVVGSAIAKRSEEEILLAPNNYLEMIEYS